MTRNPIEWIVGDLDDKRKWKEYQAQVRALPAPYQQAITALERYLNYFGATGGEKWLQAYQDLVDLFGEAAADGTPIQEVVGNDPVEFAETFAANYGDAGWIDKEKQRLRDSLAQAEKQQDQ